MKFYGGVQSCTRNEHLSDRGAGTDPAALRLAFWIQNKNMMTKADVAHTILTINTSCM